MRHLKICGPHKHQICGGDMRKSLELYILWSELSRRKLSPTLANLASAHYSFPANAIVKVVVKYIQLEPLK